MTPLDGHTSRRAELRESIADLRSRIAAACAQVGRHPSEVTLIAVTKTFPVADAQLLAELGVADLGENRDQEAKRKAAVLDGGVGPAAIGNGVGAVAPVRWHFVGQLQTNKARSVVTYATAVHSVDRIELVEALSAAMAGRERAPLTVFIQINLDEAQVDRAREDGAAPTRGGVIPRDLAEIAARVAESPALELAGVMAVAPRSGDARTAFDRLAGLSLQLRGDHPAARAISAGMSGDFAVAIAAGATHVRIGSALLGPRAPIVG